MNGFASRILVVSFLAVFSFGVGVLSMQRAGNLPLNPQQVASSTGIYDFTWSSDGRRLAFISNRNGSPELWVVAVDGGAPRRLTSTGTGKKQPRWSNDGNWIAFVVFGENETGDIHLVSADGDNTVSLTSTPQDEREPVWSPDSQEIAFVQKDRSGSRILVIDLETGTTRRLAEIPAWSLQWSPNGESIAFVSNPLLPNDDRRDNEDLFLVPAEGGTPRLLTPGTQRFRDHSPSWSPDSRNIVYVSDGTGFSNIYTLNIQTGQRQAVSNGTIDYILPKWSPAGTNIAYIRNDQSEFHIWVASIQGGRAVRISAPEGVNGGFEREDESPQGTYRWSPDGQRIAFTHSDPGRTADLWIASLDGNRTIQLTNSMPNDLRREGRFVWPNLITYRSFDGQDVSALVYEPRGAKPRTGFPTLLLFRDTLDGQHAKAWDPFVQFFVSDGYLVFAPNIRGSSGRGKGYRQLAYRQGGDHDVRDALIGLDRLSSEGLVDAGRVGVLGAGVGGFLTTAALVRDESRFNAAVCLYGIVDAVTAASYPGMDAWSRYMIGPTPMADPLPYYERSLTNFVDTLRTPIIFLYAGHDPSAPFQQLQQFAVQAEVNGKWFDYRVFQDEPKGWRYWRPANLRQALEAMDALFEKHLLGRNREIRLSRAQ